MKPSPLGLDDLGPDFRDLMTTQQYGKATPIAGVRTIDLRLMVDDGGSFAELARLNEDGTFQGLDDFQVRQVSYSVMLPGAVKAFHLHFNQEDVWFVPSTERLLIGLVDTRRESPTYGKSMRFIMGGGKTQLLYIPRGVGHGGANLGLLPATILYFVNQCFNLEAPDEHRLPWDLLGDDFWQMKRE